MADSILDIKEILNDYAYDIQEAMSNDAQRVAKEGQSKLKVTSPKRTGKYAKRWRVYTQKGRYSTECTIYNQNAGLTILLEKTHLKRNGGVVTPKSAGHIKDVEVACVNEWNKDVENIIKNGG